MTFVVSSSTTIAAALFILLAALASDARSPRSSVAVADFKRETVCPATGRSRGPCPGWEVDHITPLCAQGPDTKDNLQWLTVEDHREKTRHDVRRCRLLKAEPLPPASSAGP